MDTDSSVDSRVAYFLEASEDSPRIWFRPFVQVIARSILDNDSVDYFLSTQPLENQEWVENERNVTDADRLVELAGRTCYMAFGKAQGRFENSAYLANILESRHGSVLEHATFTFAIRGVSRTLTHELIRHRAGFGYSELSQRYVDASHTGVVLPPGIQRNTQEFYLWHQSVTQAIQTYEQLVANLSENIDKNITRRERRNIVRQTARAVLPNCTETAIIVTVNARALRHFFETRGSKVADTEIRNLAIAMLFQVHGHNLFNDIIIHYESDPPYLEVVHSKV